MRRDEPPTAKSVTSTCFTHHLLILNPTPGTMASDSLSIDHALNTLSQAPSLSANQLAKLRNLCQRHASPTRAVKLAETLDALDQYSLRHFTIERRNQLACIAAKYLFPSDALHVYLTCRPIKDKKELRKSRIALLLSIINSDQHSHVYAHLLVGLLLGAIHHDGAILKHREQWTRILFEQFVAKVLDSEVELLTDAAASSCASILRDDVGVASFDNIVAVVDQLAPRLVQLFHLVVKERWGNATSSQRLSLKHYRVFFCICLLLNSATQQINAVQRMLGLQLYFGHLDRAGLQLVKHFGLVPSHTTIHTTIHALASQQQERLIKLRSSTPGLGVLDNVNWYGKSSRLGGGFENTLFNMTNIIFIEMLDLSMIAKFNEIKAADTAKLMATSTAQPFSSDPTGRDAFNEDHFVISDENEATVRKRFIFWIANVLKSRLQQFRSHALPDCP